VVFGLLILVLVMFYACNGTAESAPTGAPTKAPSVAAPVTSAAAQPQPTNSVLTPVIEGQGGGGGGQGKPDAETVASVSPFVLPTTGVAAPTGPCQDSEIQVTATASSAKVAAGTALDFTIKFKNIGARDCQRDVGADAQELRLYSGDVVIWSSDDCDARHGASPHQFSAGETMQFTMTWQGHRSRTGAGAKSCTAPAPAPGTYQLIGRLESAQSAPFALRLT
jgi:hypothetical protein